MQLRSHFGPRVVFRLGEATLESLVNALDQFDFALLVLTPDDLTSANDGNRRTPRDNVMFELGLFMGRLGRSRTFMVCDSSADLKLASDLAGITIAMFDGRRDDKNVVAAVAPACDHVRRSIEREGVLSSNSVRHLEQAAGQVGDTSQRMAELIALLARSRVTELEITAENFTVVLSREHMERLRADLSDLRTYIESK